MTPESSHVPLERLQAPRRTWLHALGCMGMAALAAALGSVGGAPALIGAGLAVAACGLLAIARTGLATEPGKPAAAQPSGARVMARAIVPVWRQHLAASREEADRGVTGLLQHFSSLSSTLDEALAATERPLASLRDDNDGDEARGPQAGRDPQAVVPLLAPLQQLHDTSHQLRDDLDGVFVALQFQDRLHQMLTTLNDDMDRFERWLHEPAAPATAEDASRWLQHLQTTYTMPEQHAFHAGPDSGEPAAPGDTRKAAPVEFF